MNTEFLAARMSRVKSSPVIAIADRAKVMKAAGRDVIGLAQGEPDMDTPQHICDAAMRAIQQGQTRYTPVEGTPALKRAIADKFMRDHALQFAADQIIVCTGGKQVLYNAFVATVDEGDEVIIPAPYWVSYPDMVNLVGGTPVVVPCDGAADFKLSPARLAQAITPRTRWLVINSPSNPTGTLYTRDELKALGEVLQAHPRILVLTDDIYEKLIYDGAAFTTFAQAVPALAARTLTVNGVSKTYCMTGWRIGYGAGPRWLIAAMSAIQSQCTSNPSSISQAAALEALDGPQEFLASNVATFLRRRDLVVRLLNQCEGLDCRVPQGAFYVYPGCAGVIGKTTSAGRVITSDLQFCDALLEEKLVAVVPGEAFGLSPYFRISYATADDVLIEACERIRQFCASLR